MFPRDEHCTATPTFFFQLGEKSAVRFRIVVDDRAQSRRVDSSQKGNGRYKSITNCNCLKNFRRYFDLRSAELRR